MTIPPQMTQMMLPTVLIIKTRLGRNCIPAVYTVNNIQFDITPGTFRQAGFSETKVQSLTLTNSEA